MRRLPPMALALAAAAGLAGCVDALLGPEPRSTGPVASFDELWTAFDRHYSFFELKGIDWDSLAGVYRPRLTAQSTDVDLLGVMSDLLDHLEDGHVNVYTPLGLYAYTGWYDRYPDNYRPTAVDSAIDLSSSPRSRVRFGTAAPGIGYVHLANFGIGITSEFDFALEHLDGLEALIIDVRHNGGGSDAESRAVAGRIADRRRHYRTIRFRNGPEHGDFGDPIDGYIEPAGPIRFPGRVAVLTNRRTFSAAEDFVLAARTIPGVVTVGDTTGGGSGNPLPRELSNGWTFRLPRWIATDTEGRSWEGVGLGPDVFVSFGPEEDDLILARAIEELSSD